MAPPMFPAPIIAIFFMVLIFSCSANVSIKY